MAGSGFTLADLIDYEVQMARDEEVSLSELRRRDAAAGRQLRADAPAAPVGERLKGWLNIVGGPRATGASWSTMVLLVTLGLTLLGLVTGAGTARLLLSYDGSTPINVVPFLAMYVALPLILLAAVCLSGTVARLVLSRGAFSGALPEALMRWIEKRTGLSSQRAVVAGSWHRLQRLHRPVAKALLFRAIQSFGIAFYAASLATLIALVAFSDLAFGWGTTLSIDAQSFHSMIAAIARPFSWLGQDLVPSRAVIEATKYVRLESKYAGAAPGTRVSDLGSAGAWWPFLAGCIVIYGVLPRLALWSYATYSARRWLSRLPFDDAASRALLRRLQEAEGVWESGATAGTRSPASGATGTSLPPKDTPCLVVRWLDAPFSEAAVSEYLTTKFHLVPVAMHDARGTRKDTDAILAAASGERPVVFVADPFELPGEAAQRLIVELRERSASRVPVWFAPLVEDEGKLRAPEGAALNGWRHAVRALDDPFLGLLAEEGAP